MIHIVLFEPEIPQNTGNIMRSCVAFHAQLHLIKPLGFKLDESRLRRSGLDYIQDLSYTVYENFELFYV
ncbi:MAG: TrmH family RNA methyltransferase [Erysipelotrichaceae bacterium]|nr:TrmH family RNA methyltransferase [Erysipelotrichaceae bacterium]